MESAADKIVAEVKSQGVFDQFRKDSIAQVDTKPAYINLIQRVQCTVKNFLSSKVWTPEMNKIQMRERLRRHITESSFLDLGVERIVEQVVNPKISTTFQPQIEHIAYGALGIENPKPKLEDEHPEFQNSVRLIIPNGNFMPEELEQISPDSDKMTIKSDSKGSDSMDTSDDKTEDFESPEFEPIENNSHDHLEEQKVIKSEVRDPGVDEVPEEVEVKTEIKREHDNDKAADVTQESNLSQVSSLSIVSESDDTNLHASISEEAQMPKFNENSNSFNEILSTKSSNFTELAFNINISHISFEGTERKIKVESPENFPEEKTEEKVKIEEINIEKVKVEKNGNDSVSGDCVSTSKFPKEKSRDHHSEKSRDHHSSSSSHKKSSSRDKDREKDKKNEKIERSDKDKDRKSYSSSSYKKSGHSSSKDRHSSSSSSSKSKSKYSEKNSTSSKDRHSSKNDKCSTKPSVFRRKSTDSNDDNAGTDKKTSNGTSNGNRHKESNLAEANKPNTNNDSISPSETDAVNPVDELPLYYFDSPISKPNDEDFEISDSNLIRYVKVVVRQDDAASLCSSSESMASSSSPLKRKMEPETVTETKATLIIDCVDYANYEYAHKKFKSSLNKVSPTPSELSVGSKENECVKKDLSSTLRKPVERKSVVSNQRYSSEDLYKPRPILSQRSRRRGIDTNVL
ncbi:BOD1L1 family protein [Megaselia abdita]